MYLPWQGVLSNCGTISIANGGWYMCAVHKRRGIDAEMTLWVESVVK